MAKTTLSGNLRRYDGDKTELDKRISVSRTVTEYGGHKVMIAPGSTDISIMPAGLACARTLYVETDNKLNVEITGVRSASFDVYSNGAMAILNASLSNVKLSNRSATLTCKPFYDLSG